jgi:hypothetical protein
MMVTRTPGTHPVQEILANRLWKRGVKIHGKVERDPVMESFDDEMMEELIHLMLKFRIFKIDLAFLPKIPGIWDKD